MLSSNPFHSLYDLLKAFPDQQTCIKKLELLIWKGTPVSPFDSSSKVYKCAGNRYRCAKTQKYFSVLNNTIFEGTKIDLTKWFMAIFIEASHKKGISSHQLAKDINVTQKTAWFMLHRIRFALQHKSFVGKLKGQVEVDETFVGGKNGNRHKDKKVEKCHGRSFKDKVPVAGLVERSISEVIERPSKKDPTKTVKKKIIIKQSVAHCKVVSNTQGATLKSFVKENVEYGSELMSDEWQAYYGLNAYYYHRIVFHGSKQYANGDAYTNTMEGFWSILKRGIIGIYHRISKRHLQKYVDEFTFRYNTKHLTTGDRIEMLLGMVMGNRLLYKQLIS